MRGSGTNEETTAKGYGQDGGKLYLGSTIRPFAHAESNEDRVGHFDQDVVHTVDMEILHTPSLHVLQHLVVHQSAVQTTISI